MPRTAAVRRSVSRAPRRSEIPLDDEPLTPDDISALEEGRKAFARGDYCTLDEAKAYVARLRRKTRTPKARALPRS